MKNLRNKIVLVIILILTILFISLYPPTEVQSEQIVSPVADQTEDIHIQVERDHAVGIAKTIAILETGGKLDCSLKGLSGERGCHQFLPSTWKAYSLEVYGYVEIQTPEKATFVAESMIRKWLESGLSDRQIFLIWNQGHPGQCKAGVNKYGVPYDSCAYADKAIDTLKVIHTF